MANGRRRVTSVQLDELGSVLEFVLRSRIDRVHLDGRQVSHRSVASRCGWSPSDLSDRLRAEWLDKHPQSAGAAVAVINAYLEAVGEASGAADQWEGTDLVAFLEGLQDRVDPGFLEVPTRFFHALVSVGPARMVEEVLIRADALVAIRVNARSRRQSMELYRRFNDGPPCSNGPVDRTIAELVGLLCVPTPWTALVIREVAALADWAVPWLRIALLESPVGWRAVRPVPLMLRNINSVARSDSDEYVDYADHRADELTDLLQAVAAGGPPPLDPSRCFFEEAVRFAPGNLRTSKAAPADGRSAKLGWSQRIQWQDWQSSWSWVPDYLEGAALDENRTVRERAFAAVCLAERTESAPTAVGIARDMYAVTGEDPMHPFTRCADVIAAITENATQELDDSHSRYLQENLVAAVHDRGDIPATVVDAAAHLMSSALIQIDASARRRACDVLMAARFAKETAEAVTDLVASGDPPVLLKQVAPAVVGYLRHPAGLPLLLGAGSESDPAAQRSMTMAIGSLAVDDGREGLQALMELVRSGTPDIARSACYSSATRGMADLGADEREMLARQLSAEVSARPDTDPDTAGVAAWAVSWLTSNSPLPPLGTPVDPALAGAPSGA